MLCSGKHLTEKERKEYELQVEHEDQWDTRTIDPESAHGSGNAFYINSLIMNKGVAMAVNQFKEDYRKKNPDGFSEASEHPNPMAFPIMRTLSRKLSMELIEPKQYVFEQMASPPVPSINYPLPKEFVSDENGYMAVIASRLQQKGMECTVERTYFKGTFVILRVEVTDYNMAGLLYDGDAITTSLGSAVQSIEDSVMSMFRTQEDKHHCGGNIVKACNNHHTFDFTIPVHDSQLVVQSILQTEESQDGYFRCCMNCMAPLGGDEDDDHHGGCTIA